MTPIEQFGSPELMALLSATNRLHALRDLDAFPREVLSIIHDLIPSDRNFEFVEFTPEWKVASCHREPGMSGSSGVQCDKTFEEAMQGHPLIHCYEEAKNRPVSKISDFLPDHRFRRTAYYVKICKPLGIEHQLFFSIPTFTSHVAAFFINGGRKDFSEVQRTLIVWVKPHLVQAYRCLYETAQYQRVSTTLQTILESQDQGLVLLDADGEPTFVTDLARQWLNNHFHGSEFNNVLPVPLRDWTRELLSSTKRKKVRVLLREKRGKRLHVRLLESEKAGPFLLLFEEHVEKILPTPLMESFGLSRREIQVLDWLVKGKTNAEIGVILRLSHRTVEKHLEHIFTKLGVETRAAAVALAYQTTNLP